MYIASEVVQFYTEDWKPYLDLDTFNHKDSTIILSEMEWVVSFSTRKLITLQPGLERVCEKLYLALKHQMTREKDIAYSLFSIFNVAIPVMYGEGNQAVGHLLEHVLMGSRDVTILAWTGTSGSYNSCLPIDLTAYNHIVPPHIPQPIEVVDMNSMVATLRSSLLDLSSAMILHGCLNNLPSPSIAASRLQLPGISFRLTQLVHTVDRDPVMNLHVYHVTMSVFGDIEIKTKDDLTGMKDLCLVHPWIHPLLDQGFLDGAAILGKTTQALQFVACLMQPFGALLFEPLSCVEHRRVAADSLIIAQVREEASLTELMDGIHMIDIQ